MTFWQGWLIILYITQTSGYVNLQTTDNPLWTKKSRSFKLSCNGDKEMFWYKGSELLESNDNVVISKQRLVTGSTEKHETKIAIDKATPTDSGTYNCSDGTEQKSIQIKVVQGRVKTNPSSGITAFEGETLTLVCEYEGDTRLDVNWYKDQKESLASRGFVSSRRTVSNQNVKTTLQTTKTRLSSSDRGSYYCEAGPYTKTIAINVLIDSCNNRLVSGMTGIPDDKITALSYYKDILHDDSPYCARLNHTSKPLCGGWSPIAMNTRQWIQVSFPHFTVVRSIVTAGRYTTESRNEWVTAYRVIYSKDGINWDKYKDNKGKILNFAANFDKSTPVSTVLPIPVVARYLRLQPTSWNQKISLRFDVVGCLLPRELRITKEDTGKLNLLIPNHLDIQCNYTGPFRPNIVWYKDGVRILDSSGFTQTVNTSWLDDKIVSTASLTREITMYNDSGLYTCVDRTSKQNKSVTVEAAQLKMNPNFKRVWVLKNTELEISCKYSGSKTKQISWTHNSNRNVQSLGFNVVTKTKFEHSVSHTTSTITKDTTTLNNVNNITCSEGDLSRTIQVRVLTGEGHSQYLVLGEDLVLSCEIGKVDVATEMYWTKNHKPLNMIESLRGKYKYSSDTMTLSIQNADIVDAGHYECNILLEVGSSQQQHLTLPIEVNSKPTITLEGQKEVKSGDTLHLYCKVTGYPVPTIAWYKDDNPITGGDRFNFLPYDEAQKGHFVLFDINSSDKGKYQCRGTTAESEFVESFLFITVKGNLLTDNLLIVCVAVTGSVIVLAIVCCAACIRCKSKHKQPMLRTPLQNKPLLTRRYVEMQVVTRDKSMTSLEEIDQLPPPPPPVDPWEEASTIDDSSLTYERIPKIRDRQISSA
ncbi:hemicentin-1-like [Mytilus trossulus]|uniref:hemicentin-1-like n=1 Tax=Mytilus trossulus TaxID=6551 RepID=UPI003004DB1E